MSHIPNTSRAIASRGESEWWRDIPGEEHVFKLNSSNFHKLLSDKPAFVMFYASWCGYSRNARHAFAAAAERLATEGNSVLIGAVDCDECKEISARYPEINGYPSFIYLKKGAPHKVFQLSRTKEAFHAWVTQIQKQHGDLQSEEN